MLLCICIISIFASLLFLLCEFCYVSLKPVGLFFFTAKSAKEFRKEILKKCFCVFVSFKLLLLSYSSLRILRCFFEACGVTFFTAKSAKEFCKEIYKKYRPSFLLLNNSVCVVFSSLRILRCFFAAFAVTFFYRKERSEIIGNTISNQTHQHPYKQENRCGIFVIVVVGV